MMNERNIVFKIFFSDILTVDDVTINILTLTVVLPWSHLKLDRSVQVLSTNTPPYFSCFM